MRHLLLLAALAAAPSVAEEVRFPRARIVEGSIHATPAPIVDFLKTLSGLEAEDAFDPGKGAERRSELGGRTAKEWLMDHVSADFECRRDFGGICMSPDPKVRFAYALMSDEGWGALKGEPDPASPGGLAKLGLGFGTMLATPAVASGEGEHCLPGIPRITPDMDAVMAGMLGPRGPEMLEAYDNFIAVNGRYRVRAQPSVTAPVVNRLDHEAVFLPGPGQSVASYDGDANYSWTYVVPGDGPAGFAALEPADMLDLSAVSQRQICLSVQGGRVVITAHVGAGD